MPINASRVHSTTIIALYALPLIHTTTLNKKNTQRKPITHQDIIFMGKKQSTATNTTNLYQQSVITAFYPYKSVSTVSIHSLPILLLQKIVQRIQSSTTIQQPPAQSLEFGPERQLPQINNPWKALSNIFEQSQSTLPIIQIEVPHHYYWPPSTFNSMLFFFKNHTYENDAKKQDLDLSRKNH